MPVALRRRGVGHRILRQVGIGLAAAGEEESGGMIMYSDNVYKLELDSDIVRIYPNALVQIYIADTDTLKWEGTADADGGVELTDLPTGHYDMKVDGNLVKTIQHVMAEEARDVAVTWFASGTISGNFDHDGARPAFICPFAGTIEKIEIAITRIDATTDVTVHLLKGTGHADFLTVASNSAWSQRLYPEEAGIYYYYAYEDGTPAVDIADGDILAIGVDYTAGDVTGLSIQITLRPTLGV